MKSRLPKASPFVLVSTPGMHDMADHIQLRLSDRGVICPHYEAEVTQFANGEVLPKIPRTVRQQHVFLLHAMQEPDPNTALVTLLLTNDALSRADASGITDVLPYHSYLRQDRKNEPRVPISARVVADIIQTNKCVKRLITADMHTDQEQGFYSIPVDNLNSRKVFAEYVKKNFGDLSDVMVVSPDYGGALRARRFAARLDDVPIGIFEKRRPGPNLSEVVSVISDVPIEGKRVIIYDDMIDTGSTILGVAKALKEKGAREVHIFATHGLFSGVALDKFAREEFKVATMDTVPRTRAWKSVVPWLTHVSIGDLLAEAIYEASIVGGSLSKLEV